MAPMGHHSADLTRLTKVFSLHVSIYRNMYSETASYRSLSLYFFFHKQFAVDEHKFYL